MRNHNVYVGVNRIGAAFRVYDKRKADRKMRLLKKAEADRKTRLLKKAEADRKTRS